MKTLTAIETRADGTKTARYSDGSEESYSFSAMDAIGGLFGAPVRHGKTRAKSEPDYIWRPSRETLRNLTELYKLIDEYKGCNGDVDARAAILQANGYSALALAALSIVYMLDKASEEDAINFWRYEKVSELRRQVSAVMNEREMPKGKAKLIDVMLAVCEEYKKYKSEPKEETTMKKTLFGSKSGA